MRITKQLAQDVAIAILKERSVKHQQFKNETGEIIHKHLMSLLPKDVVKLFNSKDKGYLRTTSYVRAIGQGLNFDHIDTPEHPYTGNNSCTFPDELSLKISKRREISNNESQEIRNLRDQIEATLIDLRTVKKVNEFFPEASPFLSTEKATVYLPVNLDKLRSKIQQS